MSEDLPVETFRAAMHRVADHVADFLTGVSRLPVLPPVAPGEITAALPPSPPEEGEEIGRILDDYERLIEPNVTQWNHPGFFAYFATTGSAPGILGETLTAALNVNAMLWRSAPAATELEELVCDWLRQMVGLPPAFRGHINDTASTSTLVALAAARQRATEGRVRSEGLAGAGVPALAVYASDQAHSSVDKAVMTLGLGLAALRRVASDADFRLDPAALAAAMREDRRVGRRPMAVVATAGTTSTTSVDPLAEVAEICRREEVWLHVDAAYAGSAAICPELRPRFAGWEAADSIVVNPHKWLFTPLDCSVLWVREPAVVREAFSLVPAYLESGETGATNLMDYGVQLGRRFRALKLWMVVRTFGTAGLAERIRRHCAMARRFAATIEATEGFELVAPVPFSTVCFRAAGLATPAEEDRFNERLLAELNRQGPFFLSSTRLAGRVVLRLAIGNLRTTERHVDAAWRSIHTLAERLR